jgi:phosphopantetheinyl transferase
MALEKIVVEDGRAWALWRITETEEELFPLTRINETVPETITNPQKRLEWLAGRILTGEVMRTRGLPYHGIIKDEYGKPFPRGHENLQLSLSHSFPFVAVLLDDSVSAGIDLEQPKQKLLRIAPRVLHPSELQDAGQDIIKHCVYWCAKETLVKVYGKKDLTFAENLRICPFLLENEGDIVGKIIVMDKESMIPLHYLVSAGFVMVFSKRG